MCGGLRRGESIKAKGVSLKGNREVLNVAGQTENEETERH